MDFGALLHFAKKKIDETKVQQQHDGRFYITKYSPPKKMSKESHQLSHNIQKFLKKKEAEEAEKRREKNQKVAELMAKRDEKSKNKIRKMLKVTKSANKSVLDDAKDCAGTGPFPGHEAAEGQGDDYGYTSNEANALYEKYLQKVQHVQDSKTFAPSRPQSLRDLSGTKERVKAAINRELQEAESHTRQRRGTGTSTSSSSTGTPKAVSGSTKSSATPHSSSKTLYDPEAEKRDEENKKRAAEQQNRAKLKRAAQPPPMDFQALLRLAEKKQHEPVVFAQPERKKEPERLLSAKEKREMEERQRYKEERAQRDRMRESGGGGGGGENKPKANPGPNRMEPNGRIPKLASAKPSPPSSSDAKAKAPPANAFRRPTTLPVKTSSSSPSSSASPSPSASHSSHSSSSTRNPVASTKPSSSSSSTNSTTAASVGSRPATPAQKASSSGSGSKATPPPTQPSRNPYAAAVKNGVVREFPPRDRPAGSGSLAKKRARAPVPDAKGKPSKQPKNGYKRRICDDDDEYDSELDDFIDDDDCGEDISSHIRSIFGYDRRRYRDQDDDDRAMESSFAQVEREEFISQKLGLQEDLEDMRKEALHKKQKMAKKRSKRLADDSDDD